MRSFTLFRMKLSNFFTVSNLIKLECLAAVIIILIVYFASFQARIDKIRMLNRQIKEFKSRSAEVPSPEFKQRYDKMKKKLEWVKGDISSMKETMDSFNTDLSSEINVPGLFEDISKAAESNNLELVSVKPGPEVAVGEYKKVVARVVLRGRYQALLNYISEIISLKSSTYVNKISLGAGRATYPNLDIELVIVIFSK